ncbi:hypothetical protein Verru16b_02124 [Lacunisphaera limnophila]|uniref:Uncharacterized protein n=1 Tax=Lacunisphaera limnophila TaxID=1838286 RepID=A0A1D8AW20_9BACT|nr:hypothetical protein [Lacunisphaera limnophila]AOS45055.1 hypothetical protein Verru16b_02124 [Lacunisphaera limnophila]
MKWIQWLIDNAWTVIIVGTVLAQMLQAVFKKKGGDPTVGEEPPKEYEFEDPELAERTRQIRAEIQRKIEQRTRGQEEAPPLVVEATPPPVIREVVVTRDAEAAGYTRAESQRQAEILEQQAVWAEKLKEAQRLKASIEKRTLFESATADHSNDARTLSRGGLITELRTPEALRRAFVLREVLGPPVALR